MARALRRLSVPSAEAERILIKPPRLRQGDIVGLVSPAGWMDRHKLDQAAETLQRMGFVPFVHPQNDFRDHHFAGSVEERVAAIHSVYLDENIRAIMAVQGGYGTDHLLDVLDYDLIRANPKIFVGYSDVSSLLHAFRVRAGLVSFHGPMLHSFVTRRDSFTTRHLMDVLTGKDPVKTSVHVAEEAKVLRGGTNAGAILGGNLTTLTRLIGTPYELDTSGTILFIEDVDEKIYTLDRMFFHLRQAGKLSNLKGLVVADFVDTVETRISVGRTIDEIILAACKGTDFPIVLGFPCGHTDKQATLPLGIQAELITDDQSATLVFAERPVQ